MDPIAQTILDILGEEILRRVLGQASQAVAEPPDQAVRQGPVGGAQEITLHVDQMQGPPCDVVDALYEDRLFDRLMEEDDCGCHQRLSANCSEW